MNRFTLKVAGSLPGTLHFNVHESAIGESSCSASSELDMASLLANPEELVNILPTSLTREILQAVISTTGTTILVIHSAESDLDAIPWEYLPALLQIESLFVVRQLDLTQPKPQAQHETIRLLGVGWSGGGNFDLPGIREELAALTGLGARSDIQVRVLSERAPIQFTNEYDDFNPTILHLAPAAVRQVESHDGVEFPEIYISDSEGGRFVRVEDLVTSMKGKAQPLLVVLNSCHGGYSKSGASALRTISLMLNTLVIGWLGYITDRAAVDFSKFLYSRLIDGETLLDALIAYRALSPPHLAFEQATRDLGLPAVASVTDSQSLTMVWTPTLDLLNTPLTGNGPFDEDTELPVVETTDHTSGTRSGGRQRSMQVPGEAVEPESLPAISIDFEPQRWLNPALLKNGRKPIQRLALTTETNLEPVALSITCDTGNGASSVRQTLKLQRGSQPVAANRFEFPALYQLIEAAVPRRQINFTVSCSWRGEIAAEVTHSVLWMGRTEWLDRPDTWHFVPAFIDPYCDGVLDAVDAADKILKQIDSPGSTFSAYQSNSKQSVLKQTEAIFNCMRDQPLRYMPPPPLPVYTPGEQFASGQRVRTPDEVMERRRGTCHDLSILFASCLEQIQVYPLIILIRGHTFTGFWLDAAAHSRFWEKARSDPMRQPQDPGREWTMRDVAELNELVKQEKIVLVEATYTTNPSVVFSDAMKEGKQKLENSQSRSGRFDVAIDIQASRRSIQPL